MQDFTSIDLISMKVENYVWNFEWFSYIVSWAFLDLRYFAVVSYTFCPQQTVKKWYLKFETICVVLHAFMNIYWNIRINKTNTTLCRWGKDCLFLSMFPCLCLCLVFFFLYSFVSIFASRFSVTLCLSNFCLYHISTLPRSPPPSPPLPNAFSLW